MKRSPSSNLEAVTEWIFELVLALDRQRAGTLDSDRVIPRYLELCFDERVEDVFALAVLG